MGSLKNMEPFWWETKPKTLTEWVNEWRKKTYHQNPRTTWRIDYDLTAVSAVEERLKQKLYWQRQTR